MNNKFSLIFNLTNNKLIGIYNNTNKIFNKGIIFDALIKEFIDRYENRSKCINEIDILINVKKQEINEKIYFLDTGIRNSNEKENDLYFLIKDYDCYKFSIWQII